MSMPRLTCLSRSDVATQSNTSWAGLGAFLPDLGLRLNSVENAGDSGAKWLWSKMILDAHEIDDFGKPKKDNKQVTIENARLRFYSFQTHRSHWNDITCATSRKLFDIFE